MAEIYAFLDKFESERDARFVPKSELRQYKGFRHEWNEYLTENMENLNGN